MRIHYRSLKSITGNLRDLNLRRRYARHNASTDLAIPSIKMESSSPVCISTDFYRGPLLISRASNAVSNAYKHYSSRNFIVYKEHSNADTL